MASVFGKLKTGGGAPQRDFFTSAYEALVDEKAFRKELPAVGKQVETRQVCSWHFSEVRVAVSGDRFESKAEVHGLLAAASL